MEGDGRLPFSKDDVVIQCVVQLLLIDMLQDAIAQHYDHIPPAGIMILLDALQRSFEFAQEFNQQIELRQTLKRLGFMREMKNLPGLLKQEREALSCSCKILFQVQGDARMMKVEATALGAEQRLRRLCQAVLKSYVGKERLLQESQQQSADHHGVDYHTGVAGGGVGSDREAVAVEMEREVMGLAPIISEVVLKGLKELHSDQFAGYAPDLFPLLCELTVVNSREVRVMVRDVLRRVTPLVGRPAACGASIDSGTAPDNSP
jgi:hypothetical protein